MEFVGKAFLFTEEELDSMVLGAMAVHKKELRRPKQDCDTCVHVNGDVCGHKDFSVKNQAIAEIGGCYRYTGRNANDA